MMLAHNDGVYLGTLRLGKTVRLIPGDYEMVFTELNLAPDAAEAKAEPAQLTLLDLLKSVVGGKSDKKDRTIKLWAYSHVKAPPLTVRPGAQAIAFGPPFKLTFEAKRWGDEKEHLEMERPRLVGAAGAWYYALCVRGDDTVSKLTCFIRSGGEERKLRDLEFG
jgi:hypothetical protein